MKKIALLGIDLADVFSPGQRDNLDRRGAKTLTAGRCSCILIQGCVS